MTETFAKTAFIVYVSEKLDIEFDKSTKIEVKRVIPNDEIRLVINTNNSYPKATVSTRLSIKEAMKLKKALDTALDV